MVIITSISIAHQGFDVGFYPDVRIIMPIATTHQSDVVIVAFNHPGIKTRFGKLGKI